jgi:hypothetical protein
MVFPLPTHKPVGVGSLKRFREGLLKAS